MKRILCVLLVLGLMLSFVGCKKDMNRELYNLNLEKYVELGDYMSIRIDTTTEDFKKINDEVIAYDVQSNLFYKGTVAKGDVVNIDYIGKKDGVALKAAQRKVTTLLSVRVHLSPVLKKVLSALRLALSLHYRLPSLRNITARN
jgi:hypothetical protein